MNTCSVNNMSFGARIQFDNKMTNTKKTLPQKTRQALSGVYVNARRIFIVPVFFSAILSKIIKVRKSIKIPS